jgi:hypothetical protein
MGRSMMRFCACLGGIVFALILSAAQPVTADQPAWEQWQHVVGIVDVGVRADGSLVAMVNGRLFLVSSAGGLTPFATGADGFSGDPNAEPYFISVPALSVDTAGCKWNADDLFILDLSTPPGLIRVDPSGRATHFTTLAGVDTLGGIAIDTTGRFGHRLLVTGTHDGDQTTVFSVDCAGSSALVVTSAPQVEGGLAVAPSTFGAVAGDLIAPDENTGRLYAIDPSGTVTVIANSGLPTGSDTGVESEGFVPPGFVGGGNAYLADRGTPNNPFPGTDSLLRLSSSALSSAGVEEGDLLVSTEGGGTTIDVRCSDTCTVVQVATGTPGGHIEGHLVVVADHPAP